MTRLPKRIVPPIRVLSPSGMNTTTCTAITFISVVFNKLSRYCPKDKKNATVSPRDLNPVLSRRCRRIIVFGSLFRSPEGAFCYLRPLF